VLNLEGAFNAPLGNSAQLRVSGVSRYHEGYRKIVGIPGMDLHGVDSELCQGTVARLRTTATLIRRAMRSG